MCNFTDAEVRYIQAVDSLPEINLEKSVCT